MRQRCRLFETDASAVYHAICPLFITRVYFSCLPPICPLFITPTRVYTVCRLMGDDVRQVTVGCVMRMRPLFTTPYVRCLTPVCTLSVYPPPHVRFLSPQPACPAV